MKKKILYSICAALLVVAGCTKFDEETPVAFTKGPGVTIDVTATTDTSVTFTVTPDAAAGYYSYLLVEKSKAPAALDSSRVLKLLYDGVAKATVNYASSTTANVYVKKLTPNTAYQIYAVASNTSGMAGSVANTLANTGDNGDAPAPKTVGIADSTVSITFSEPIVRGEGALSVTFHAVYNSSVGYNPTVGVPADSLSVDGAVLSINLPPHPAFGFVPAGAWVTVTYDAGVVKDLSGISAANATNTGVLNTSTGQYSGLSARVATTTWGFDPVEEDELIPIVSWAAGQLTIGADSTLFAPIAGRAKPYQFLYKETGKTTALEATATSYNTRRDSIFLLTGDAEEAKRGAIIDAVIPEGAFVDIFGNPNTEFAVEDAYIYSYGYTKAAVLGTYNIDIIDYSANNDSETGIVIADYGDGSTDTVLVKNLFTSGTEIKAVFNGVLGTLSIPDDQLLLESYQYSTYTGDVYFVNTLAYAPVVFSVPAAGQITSEYPNSAWGYYYVSTIEGWLIRYQYSEWTRQP